MHTIGPRSFLFGTAQFSLCTSGTVNYDYIVTNIIKSFFNWLQMYNVFPMAHTLTIVEPNLARASKSIKNSAWRCKSDIYLLPWYIYCTCMYILGCINFIISFENITCKECRYSLYMAMDANSGPLNDNTNLIKH